MELKEKKLEKMLMAGYRVKAKYEEMPTFFEKLYPAFKDEVTGPGFAIYYDEGQKEIADYEVAFPVKEIKNSEEFSVRELKGGKAITTTYEGSYDGLGNVWEKFYKEVIKQGYRPNGPAREVYLVCSDMVDNPDEYITELQIMVE